MRRNALSAWQLDVPVTPDADGLWVNKRDPSHRAPVEEVTWQSDGVRYLRPEIALLLKAKAGRGKDTVDLHRTLPHLGSDDRQWLRATLDRLYPGHAWLAIIDR